MLGLTANYGFGRQRHESCRSDVDQRLKDTISHKKQQLGVRALDGLAKQAQLSAADLLVYATANEVLMQNNAFHGWRSPRHSVVNVRVIACGLSSSQCGTSGALHRQGVLLWSTSSRHLWIRLVLSNVQCKRHRWSSLLAMACAATAPGPAAHPLG